MASLENRTGYYNVVFRFGGQKFTRSLKTDSESEAERRKSNLDETIRLVERGRLEIPAGADVPTFLLSDGKLTQPTEFDTAPTLDGLFEQFFDALPADHLEDSTIYGMKVHRRHLIRLLGKRFPVQQLTLADLQGYVGKRSKENGRRGGKVGANTIHKEIVTFRTVWGWAVNGALLAGDFPRKGLKLPKSSEQPPFQTWKEIERQIERTNPSEGEQAALWDCLYLNLQEIGRLLAHVKTTALQPWLYPMFVMAAHTGARRSELVRSQVTDFDDDFVIIHERKRKRGRHTTRRVPLSSTLREVIADWLANHPGGVYTFCQDRVIRSKKRRSEPQAVTRDEANHHFHQTLDGSKWEKIKGWHCLRHSFISNLASRGVDQRMIDEFVGHSTEAMRRRYRHLFPETKAAAIQQVFG